MSCTTSCVWGWGAHTFTEGHERRWGRPISTWISPSGNVECHCVSDSSQPHSRVHSHVCFTQLSAEGVAQLTSAMFLDFGFYFFPFRSSVSPFRVTAPADMAICSQVITVVRFESTILELFKEKFSFVTTENHLMQIKSKVPSTWCLSITTIK